MNICAAGRCVSTLCAGGPCPAGQVCDQGACRDARCVDVFCGAGRICSGGQCLPTDPTCAPGSVFVSGRCLDVRCDGGNSLLGHPVEFLTLARGDEVVCGYCGRRYVHISHAEAERLRASGTPQAA